VRPPTATAPASINAFNRLRDNSATCAASTRSSRAPASSPATVIDFCVIWPRFFDGMLDRSGNPSAAPPAPAPQDADAAGAMVARARSLMIISALTTAVAVAAVLGVIGYRIFHAGRSASPTSAVLARIVTLPKGARVVSTATAGDRIVVTIELAGTTEIRTFDADTLQETGRLRFATEP
jgi:hypothetical protein